MCDNAGTMDENPRADAPNREPSSLAQPGVIAGLWILTTLIHIADQLRFPDFEDGFQYVSSVLFLATTPVLAALLAAAVARTRDAALTFAGALMALWLTLSLAWFGLQFAVVLTSDATAWTGSLLALLVVVLSAIVVFRIARRQGVSRKRRWAAALVALCVLTLWPALSMFDEELYGVSAQNDAGEDAADLPPQIDEERLWTAQPALVEKALATMATPTANQPATYLITVGAGGVQDLFGREARTARGVLGRAFGAEQRSVVLANDKASLERVPLANNSNLTAVLNAVGKRADLNRDTVVVFLTAHGSQKAELGTDLPDYTDLSAISARTLAKALRDTGIRRRIVIVSACYSGSWIKPLASDDTIVVTAARADRTSFGCSDDRELTYFGEALLKGPIKSGASLADAFAATKRTVARWEQGEELHSEPQAFVGNNMTAAWTAPTAR